jgi:hypothetical protein
VQVRNHARSLASSAAQSSGVTMQCHLTPIKVMQSNVTRMDERSMPSCMCVCAPSTILLSHCIIPVTPCMRLQSEKEWCHEYCQEVDVHRLWCDFVCIRELLSSRFGSRGNDGEAMDEENSSLIHR